MVFSDSNTKFVDKTGIDHAIEELKKYIDGAIVGDIDLSDYVTQQQLQDALDSLDINIDLSAYATKEELQQAIASIDLSGYALIAYVDDAIANIPSGGGQDGITPHIDSTTKHWFIGDTDTGVVAEGQDGTNGIDGTNGEDGFSPTASVTKVGNKATITITDKNGTTTATISDGKDGSGGGGSSGGSEEVYSTEEVAIGTWIDGRTIYRKVIDFSDVNSTNSNGFLFYTLTDSTLLINEVVDSKLILKNNTTFYSSSQITSTLSSSSVSAVVKDINSKIVARSMHHTVITSASSTIFQVFIGTSYSGTKKIYLILEYTKP